MKVLLGLVTSISVAMGAVPPAVGGVSTPSDLQNAIDSSPAGTAIQLSSGTFNWGSGVNVNKYVKIVGSNTVINSTTGSTLFILSPQAAGCVELSGVTFNGSSGLGAYVRCNNTLGRPPLVHDCTFNAAGFGHGCIIWSHNGGVIYRCTFVSTDKADNSAIQFKNDQSDDAWRDKDYLGSTDINGDLNTYVEDCTFRYQYLQAMDIDDNSRVVIRNSTLDNAAIASHGQETSPIGGRQCEIYNNTFIFTGSPAPFPLNLNRFIFIRGGGPWLIWGNTIPDINSQMWGNKTEIDINLYNIRRSSGYVPCQTSYPAARQMGFGSNTNGNLVSSPMYFWGNTGSGSYNNPSFGDYNPDECGNNKHTSDFVQVGRDLFLGTAKPGYTPYTYPHPLRTGGSQPTPSPTSQPTPTPTPSATPSPSPTAPPTSGSFSQWLDQLSDWIRLHPATPNK